MSKVQNFFKAILPGSWAKSMEAESRRWIVRCNDCGFEKSVWDMGGVRWKAAGNPSNKIFCRNCKKVTWHTTYKKEKNQKG